MNFDKALSLLEVSKDTINKSHIKKAYHKKARQYHPDKAKGLPDNEKKKHEDLFKDINNANELLNYVFDSSKLEDLNETEYNTVELALNESSAEVKATLAKEISKSPKGVLAFINSPIKNFLLNIILQSPADALALMKFSDKLQTIIVESIIRSPEVALNHITFSPELKTIILKELIQSPTYTLKFVNSSPTHKKIAFAEIIQSKQITLALIKSSPELKEIILGEIIKSPSSAFASLKSSLELRKFVATKVLLASQNSRVAFFEKITDDTVKSGIELMMGKILTYKPASFTRTREHAFEAKAEGNINTSYANLRGDMLKTQILAGFLSSLQGYSKTEVTQKIADFKKSDEYKILNKSQGKFTQFFHLKTDSVAAFEKIAKQAKAGAFVEEPKNYIEQLKI